MLQLVIHNTHYMKAINTVNISALFTPVRVLTPGLIIDTGGAVLVGEEGGWVMSVRILPKDKKVTRIPKEEAHT